MINTILFDFFGTLVDYSPSRVGHGCEETHRLLVRHGIEIEYDIFLQKWESLFERFDHWSRVNESEYSMLEVSSAFLRDFELGGRETELAPLLADCYVSEWSVGIKPINGVPEFLRRLASKYTLAVVSNTHHPTLVPDQLRCLDMHEHIAAIITSVEHGKPKPHHSIYERALEILGASAENCLFVGDSYIPDYQGPKSSGLKAVLICSGEEHNIPREHAIPSILELEEAIANIT